MEQDQDWTIVFKDGTRTMIRAYEVRDVIRKFAGDPTTIVAVVNHTTWTGWQNVERN